MSCRKKYGSSFTEANAWRRLAVIIAGPVFNVVLGFIIAFIMVNLIAIRDPVATEIIPGGAAEEAGLSAEAFAEKAGLIPAVR